jgi:hypothetical protein
MDRLLSFSPEPFELDFEFEGTLKMPTAPKCGYCGGELQCPQCNNHSTYFRRASHVLGVTDAPLESESETGLERRQLRPSRLGRLRPVLPGLRSRGQSADSRGRKAAEALSKQRQSSTRSATRPETHWFQWTNGLSPVISGKSFSLRPSGRRAAACRQGSASSWSMIVPPATAVSINMPLEKARLHAIVQGRPLPDFAKELDIQTWSAFFLKWIISNPVVTVALPATTNPDHLVENMAALRGPLPDTEMRARMVRHMETIPGFDKIAEMAWYPGKTFRGVISHAQQDLRKRA